jgi:hypothetical protein
VPLRWRCFFLVGPAPAEVRQEPYVRVAEIEIDPAQLDPYEAAAKEQIDRLEPGVLALYRGCSPDSSNMSTGASRSCFWD